MGQGGSGGGSKTKGKIKGWGWGSLQWEQVQIRKDVRPSVVMS